MPKVTPLNYSSAISTMSLKILSYYTDLGKICIDEVMAGFKKMGIMISENEAALLLHR